MIDEIIKLRTYLDRHDSISYRGVAKRLVSIRSNLYNLAELDPSKSNVNAIKKEVESLMKRVYDGYVDEIKADMSKVAMITYDWTSEALMGKPQLSFGDLPEAAIKRVVDINRPILGEKLRDNVTAQMFSANSRFRKAIGQALFEGRGTIEAINAVRAVIDKELDKTLRYADTLTRTAVLDVSNRAMEEIYRQFDDVIIGWQSISVLDGRTTPMCIELSKKVYMKPQYKKVGDIPDRPPSHYNCRRVIIAITRLSDLDESQPYTVHEKKTVNHQQKTVEKTGRKTHTEFKAVKRGESRGSYGEWFDAQDDSFQKDVLGSERFDLYKTGRYKINDFIDVRRNRYYTAEEMAERVPSKRITARKSREKEYRQNLEGKKISVDTVAWDKIKVESGRVVDYSAHRESALKTADGLTDRYRSNLGKIVVAEIAYAGEMNSGVMVLHSDLSLKSRSMKEKHGYEKELEYAIVHEFAHAIFSRNDRGAESFYRKLLEVFGRYRMELQKSRENLISEYSRQDPDEFFAEAFAHYYLGSNNRYAKEVGALVEEYFGKGK